MVLYLSTRCLGMAGILSLCLTMPGAADAPAAARSLSLNELSLEVAALQTLYQFQLTHEQLEKVRKCAKDTADEPGARPTAKASADFRRVLTDFRKALVDANDPDRIGDLAEQVDKLRESEKPDLDDSLEVTDVARKRAPEILRLLSARQVAGYLAAFGDALPDPVEALLEALVKVRGLQPKEWKQLREDISDEIGRLVAGLDADKAGRVGDKVVQLLIHSRALKDDEFKAQKHELEKTARQIIGEVGPLDILRHLAEQGLAEMLSNPRLTAAIEARLKK